VGAARFLQGLIEVVPQENITIVVNTGDDMELLGLHISPDPDIILYTLSGIVDEEKGWGVKDDTFNFLSMIKDYGLETWFRLGDKDVATHIYRTSLLKNGLSLSAATTKLCRALGLGVNLVPMTNAQVVPRIVTEAGKMHFEEYLIKRGAADEVLDVVFEGAESANPAPGVIEAIQNADGIIVCPSNPIVSIGPILALRPIRKALKETTARICAISPIVEGAPVKGPADKLMRGLGLEVSAYSVAFLYRDFLDFFILDEGDRTQKKKIENLGIRAITANTIMRSRADKIELAKLALRLLE
jgi:LPPG:FO 2-phospho-L-lactate transferase